MADALLQRRNMIESQVRPSDITDRRILRAMEDIEREVFVAPEFKSLAYMDEAVPVSLNKPMRALMPPRAFAKLLQLAELSSTGAVLDVGTATGYSAAVIARIAQTVVALEADTALANEAVRVLATLSAHNVTVVTGDLAAGHPEKAPYDAIVLEGAVPEVPAGLLAQLKDGGRLVAMIGGAGLARAVVWRRSGENFDRRGAFEASAPPLPGFEPVPRFEF